MVDTHNGTIFHSSRWNCFPWQVRPVERYAVNGRNPTRRTVTGKASDMANLQKMANALVPRESRPERVGPRIRAMRETIALSPAQLADTIGLDRSTLSKIEQGKVGLGIHHGEAIAAQFGFGLNFIYRGDLSDVPDRYRSRLLVEMVTHRAN
jgi:DNA-binding XRE family transcriptional regulator